ncbi:MAG: hypothetical protein M3141_09365 [Actinomycetota bacterium]|nr:hypothetical protein [Actinomycetota bacterium]
MLGRTKKLALLAGVMALGALAIGGVAAAGHGNGKQRHTANLRAVPHDPVADSGSNVRGAAKIKLRGTRANVRVHARGLTAGLPHAMHIHGKDNAEVAFCPGGDRRDDLVDDGLIETVEGLADYGGIQVSLTTRGDTSADSGLALDRFAVARRSGKLNYRRTLTLPHVIAERLEDKHIVIHGADLDRDGKYGGRTTALGAPLEAELPVACGSLVRIR